MKKSFSSVNRYAKLSYFAFLLVAFAVSNANAFELYAGGGALFSKPNDPSGTSFTSKQGIIYGGGLGFNIIPKAPIGIELGAVYGDRKFNSSGFDFSSKTVIGHALFRVHVLNFFSLMAGPYYSSAQGKITLSGGGLSMDFSHSDLSLKKSDAGVLGILRLYVFPRSPVHLFIDGRYYHGLLNTASVGKLYYRDFAALAGLRLHI